MEGISFGLGLFIGMFIMWRSAMKLKSYIIKEIEKLKDFEEWKKWK